MPVNKGLLFGAAVANGLNAFLDAREKGDLQRQRQAMVDFDKQMKTMQMEQAQQRIDLGKGQLKFDREKLLADASKPGPLNATEKALAELNSEVDFRVQQGVMSEDDRPKYLQQGMLRKGFAPLSEEEKLAQEKELKDKTDPLLSDQQLQDYRLPPGARVSATQGLKRSRKKTSLTSDGDQLVITDAFDPGSYELVDISDGLDPQVAIDLANNAVDYGNKVLGSSNRTVKNFQDVEDAYVKLKVSVNAAKTEIDKAKREGRKASFVAIDNAITTVFIKMLDPGSVVREQEYKRLLADMGITERWIGRIGNAIRGGYLTETSRDAVMGMAEKLMLASELNYMKEYVKHYGRNRELGDVIKKGEGEKYAHLATGIEFSLSDGTVFDFKGMTYEQLDALRKAKTKELLPATGDFRSESLGQLVGDGDKKVSDWSRLVSTS